MRDVFLSIGFGNLTGPFSMHRGNMSQIFYKKIKINISHLSHSYLTFFDGEWTIKQ